MVVVRLGIGLDPDTRCPRKRAVDRVSMRYILTKPRISLCLLWRRHSSKVGVHSSLVFAPVARTVEAQPVRGIRSRVGRSIFLTRVYWLLQEYTLTAYTPGLGDESTASFQNPKRSTMLVLVSIYPFIS
eukprot:6331364-Pyramimonas_sp.AAC.1